MTFLGPLNYVLKSADIFKKLIILIVFSIFIITGPAVAGYCIRAIRAIRDGNDELPNLEFGDFGELFVDGLRLGVQMLLLMLPTLIISLISFTAMFTGKDGAIVAAVAVILIVGLLNALIFVYYGTAVTCLAIEDSSWLLAFKFSELNEIVTAKRSNYFKAVGCSIIWNILFSLVSSFVPIVGSFIASPFTMAAQAYFSGMYMREIRGGQKLAPAANVYDASAGNQEDIDYSHDHSADLYDNSDY